VLLDVGTKPSPSGILNLLKGFDNYNVGGVTGLMSVDSSLKSE
jgi:cellulose synthase/poly-beta-1,6-N-acetylglucosamine synthase-like glycosyltransferase